jgi:ubiquinone/menaquinone biosynthesis C-methylase UbiE
MRRAGAEWYDRIAEKMEGYIKNWSSTKEGLSGEDVFKENLISLLKTHPRVLDARCGHGEFTLKMSPFAASIIGIDFSEQMIIKANELLHQDKNIKISNVRFVYAKTKNLPFKEEQFDLIYSRRDPTSVIYDHRLLRPGGTIMGIHSQEKEKVLSRLHECKFRDIEVKEYVAYEYFPTVTDFAKFFSRMPGHPNYLDSCQQEQLEQLVKRYKSDKGLCYPEY